MRVANPTPASERGMTLIELMVALVVLALGILAVGRMFPMSSMTQNTDRMTTAAQGYAQQKLEELQNLSWSDPALSDGHHPAGIATESLGNGGWQRFYQVSTLATPLDNLKRVIVTVNWTVVTAHAVDDTLYVRR